MLKKIELGQRKPSVELATLLFHALQLPAGCGEAFFSSADSGIAEPALWEFGRELPMQYRPISSAPDENAGLHQPRWIGEAGPPQLVTSLIGRDADVAALISMLKQPAYRLITLFGAPGVGKTQLALAVAKAYETQLGPAKGAGRQTSRIVFVSLAEERDPARLPQHIAAALGLALPIHQNRANDAETFLGQHILAHLQKGQTGRCLIILDSIEHMLPAASFINVLISASPEIQVLVTSRISLRLFCEHTFQVEPLATPGLDSTLLTEALVELPSVKLFLERIQFYNPHFQMHSANIRAAAFLCAQLDGLPLALELVAARAKTFNMRMLLGAFQPAQASVGPPTNPPVWPDLPATAPSRVLALLTQGARDLPVRLQSLTNAIAWSYNLLRPDEQKIFEGLAVFEHGFSYATAESVVGASVEMIEKLAAHSLIQVEVLADGELYFRMLRVIREYAAERSNRQRPLLQPLQQSPA